MWANVLLIVMLSLWLVVYGLNVRRAYPRAVIEAFSQPHVRLLLWMGVYALSYINPIVGLLAAVGLALLHLDYVNLVLPNNFVKMK